LTCIKLDAPGYNRPKHNTRKGHPTYKTFKTGSIQRVANYRITGEETLSYVVYPKALAQMFPMSHFTIFCLTLIRQGCCTIYIVNAKNHELLETLHGSIRQNVWGATSMKARHKARKRLDSLSRNMWVALYCSKELATPWKACWSSDASTPFKLMGAQCLSSFRAARTPDIAIMNQNFRRKMPDQSKQYIFN
jgi:hypothetical protein